MKNTANSWSTLPFVRLLIPFIIGIMFSYWLSLEILVPNLILFLAGIILLLFLGKVDAGINNYSRRFLAGISIHVMLFLIGYNLTENTCRIKSVSHFHNKNTGVLNATTDLNTYDLNNGQKVNESDMVYLAMVKSKPVETTTSYKAMVEVRAIDNKATGNKLQQAEGNIMVWFIKDTLDQIPEYGDIIAFSKKPKLVVNSGNPGEFDFAGFLKLKRIYHTLYLKSEEYLVASKGNGNYLKVCAYQSQAALLKIISKGGLAGADYYTAAALLTGYDDTLPLNQRKTFSDAGVIHVLCVSGLHVGIIYMLANFILSLLPLNKASYIFRPLMVIIAIWVFALISGLAAPVTRAAFMFSMILLGATLRRPVNKFNILAATAFFLLVTDPLLLFNVGFQLSFFAVAGIMLFKTPISNIWIPKNPLLFKLWELVTISISAQILITPLLLYYFHRFPVYFVLANLIAVPLSGIIIYTGVTYFIVSSIPYLSVTFSTLLKVQVRFLNSCAEWISALPVSVIENIHISLLSTFLLFIALSSLAYFIINHKKLWIWTFMSALLLLSISYAIRKHELDHQQMIVFHKTGIHPLISFVHSRSHIILTDSTLFCDMSKAKAQVEGMVLESGLNEASVYSLKTCYNRKVHSLPEFYVFKGNELVVISGKCMLPQKMENTKVSFVLLCNNPEIRIKKVAECFPNAKIIIDNSCNEWKIKQFSDEASSNGIDIYNLKSEGAMVVKL